MSCMPKDAATRKYNQRFVPTMALYAVFLCISIWIFRHHYPVGPLAYALAVLPALPILGSIVITGLYLVEQQDEFQRNLIIQSMLWGIGLTMAVLTVWGFLELLIDIPHFQAYLAYPMFWFFVGITTPIVSRRYR